MKKQTMQEAKKRVGIWIRVSTDFQVKDDSPEHHEQRARYYAEAKDWDIVEVYQLDAMSGKSVMDYAETKRMLKDIKSGHITGLIFSKLARLARNTRELLDFSQLFRAVDADLISLSENIDTSTPAGRLFYTMIAAMAEWEREEIAERVAASVPIRAKMGKPLGGQASFGFQWNGKELAINEQEAPVRKLIYELFAQLKRKKTTADELNKRGYRTRNGSQFSDTTVSRLLRDPSAKGERRANYTKSTGEGKKWEFKSAEDWIIVPCPKIVEPGLWNECNAILDQQERKYTRAARRAIHLLSGFVTCHCGGRMAIKHSNKVYSCKNCKNRIAAEDLDEIYHEKLAYYLIHDKSTFQNQFEGQLETKIDLLDSVKATQVTLQAKANKLLQLRLHDEIDPKTFAKEHKPLEEQLNQIDQQIPHLEAEIDFLKVQAYSSESVLQDAADLYSKWQSLTFEERRSIVEVITDKIIIGKDDIAISLAFLPSTPLSESGDFIDETVTLRGLFPGFGERGAGAYDMFMLMSSFPIMILSVIVSMMVRFSA